MAEGGEGGTGEFVGEEGVDVVVGAVAGEADGRQRQRLPQHPPTLRLRLPKDWSPLALCTPVLGSPKGGNRLCPVPVAKILRKQLRPFGGHQIWL